MYDFSSLDLDFANAPGSNVIFPLSNFAHTSSND
jgi:hypothetical protein